MDLNHQFPLDRFQTCGSCRQILGKSGGTDKLWKIWTPKSRISGSYTNKISMDYTVMIPNRLGSIVTIVVQLIFVYLKFFQLFLKKSIQRNHICLGCIAVSKWVSISKSRNFSGFYGENTCCEPTHQWPLEGNMMIQNVSMDHGLL